MPKKPEQAAFGIYPQMKPRRSRQDPEAAKNFPVDFARGALAGLVGMPGDIESLGRLPYELITGNESPTFLPTSEDVLKRIPFGSETPVGQFASGLGTLAGGSANIGAIPRAVKAGAKAARQGALNLAAPRTLNPQAGAVMIPNKFKAPQDEALRLARKRAKEVGQSENPRSRMLQQGYDNSWYHGTTGDIKSFSPDLLGETTGAQSAKKGFFFARDPLNPPESMLKKSNNPAAEQMLRELGIPEEEIARLNTVSMKGHGSETASGYALIGGSREYKEAMRKAKAAESRGDWAEYEKQMQIAEDSEITRNQYAQGLVAKYGDARDEMLDAINNAYYGDKTKGLSQSELEALDVRHKQLMPYGWYNSYGNPQLDGLKKELINLVGENSAKDAIDKINKFQSVKNERVLAEKTQEGGNVMPVALRYENPMVYDFEGKPYRDQSYSDLVDQALAAGKDALILKNTYDPGGGPSKLIDVGVVFEPDQIRSRFAAFDPLRKTAATAAAAGLAAPDLLAEDAPKSEVHISDNPDVMQLELAGGGLVKRMAKAVGKAAESAGQKAPVLAQKDLTTLQDTHTMLGDKVRAGAMEADKMMQGFDYKYDKGQRVFTKDSADKNKPPYTILSRTRVGNQVMREDHPEFGPGMGRPIIDPETGKAMRTPYEPGYRVRMERGPDDWSEFEIPQKAVVGDVEMAGGGAVNMQAGGLAKLAKTAKAAKEAAVPLSLPRVRPTTKDILEAAERVGKQQAGEFVKSPLTTKTSNLAGRSKKEVERLKEMEYKLTPIKDLPEMKPYEAKIGEVNIALPGDQTVSDMLLESVDGIPIGTTSEGGALFGRGRLADPEDKRAFWASNIGPAELFQKKVTELAQLYDTDMVTAYHLAMGQMSNNFAQHMADANLRAIDYSKLNKDKMNAFDRVMLKGYVDPTTKERVTFENWPGIASPEDALLMMKEDPKLRKWFNNRMKTEKVTKPLDLPNAKSIEWAMTEPELRNMEINLTGLSAGRMKPGAELIPDSAHQTYSHDIPGTALGRAPELSPFSISFPDATAFVREKYRPQDFTGTIQKVFPHQVVDEAYLDDMYKYYTQLRKVRGYKKGGTVRKAAGGEITADDLILEERKL